MRVKLSNRHLTKISIAIFGCLLGTMAWPVVDRTPSCQDVFANKPLSLKYQDNSDGTITDLTTDYTWYRCNAGQTWTDGVCEGQAILHDFEGAQQWAMQAAVAGRSNWRVPTIDEMKTLVEKDCRSPAIDINAFPGIEAENYWSSEDNFWNGSLAWALFFFKGSYYAKHGKFVTYRFMLITD